MKIARIIFLFSLIAMVSSLGCQSTQQMQQFSVNEKGYIELGKDAINKDAVRLQGLILSKGKKVGDRLIYEMEVEQVLRLGATFANAEPRQGERVELITLNTVKLKRNSKVIIDAQTPMRRGEGAMRLDMIKD